MRIRVTADMSTANPNVCPVAHVLSLNLPGSTPCLETNRGCRKLVRAGDAMQCVAPTRRGARDHIRMTHSTSDPTIYHSPSNHHASETHQTPVVRNVTGSETSRRRHACIRRASDKMHRFLAVLRVPQVRRADQTILFHLVSLACNHDSFVVSGETESSSQRMAAGNIPSMRGLGPC